MTKQPVLTGFPCTVFATAKRRLQAAIRRQRATVLRDSICGYALVFSSLLPASFLTDADPTKRNRHFGHIPAFWAWLAQILEGNASCSKALSLIQSWSRSAGLPVPVGGTGGFCLARKRVRLEFLHSILARIGESLRRSIRPEDLWHGRVVKAIDGSSVQLTDTGDNQQAFPQPSSQSDGCGFPTMGIVGVLNLAHGGWEGIVSCPQSAHDSAVAPRLLGHIEDGDMLLADRAYCTFELIARLQAKGADAVMRLHQARHAKLDWRRGRKISPIERIVEWEMPATQPAGSTLSKEQWDALPRRLKLRYIRLGYEDRAGCKRMLVVVTTLLDPDVHDALEVANLYARRWDIELKLRDVKTTLGMERFEVRSPAMAERTLLMMMIATNLLRGLMQRAATQAGKPVWQVSFKGVRDHVIASHESYTAHRGRPRKLTAHHESVIEVCATKIVDIRPFRNEPRAVKRRPKNYSLLTRHRHVFREVPHRGNPRSAA